MRISHSRPRPQGQDCFKFVRHVYHDNEAWQARATAPACKGGATARGGVCRMRRSPGHTQRRCCPSPLPRRGACWPPAAAAPLPPRLPWRAGRRQDPLDRQSATGPREPLPGTARCAARPGANLASLLVSLVLANSPHSRQQLCRKRPVAAPEARAWYWARARSAQQRAPLLAQDGAQQSHAAPLGNKTCAALAERS